MKEEVKKSPWRFTIFWLFAILAFSYLTSYFISYSLDYNGMGGGNVALINVKGFITTEGNGGLFGTTMAVSTDIIEYIEKASKDDSIKAIVFEINSGGGSPVGSKEIVNAIKKANKTTVSYIREVGASGAYWVASATDTIIADELSITGSIGVRGSYIEFAGLLEKYNMSYRRLVGGDRKDLGDPFRALELDEEKILQEKINIIHDYFIKDVAKNRGMSVEEMKKIATGEFYLGIEAMDLGLIDMFGDKETAKELVEKELNITVDFKTYERAPSFLDMLTKVMNQRSFFMGRGIGAELMNVRNTDRVNIVT